MWSSCRRLRRQRGKSAGQQLPARCTFAPATRKGSGREGVTDFGVALARALLRAAGIGYSSACAHSGRRHHFMYNESLELELTAPQH
jgi:hypothetical protein